MRVKVELGMESIQFSTLMAARGTRLAALDTLLRRIEAPAELPFARYCTPHTSIARDFSLDERVNLTFGNLSLLAHVPNADREPRSMPREEGGAEVSS